MQAPSGVAGADDPIASKRAASLLIAAIGVVYGDIGTSPLYTLRECFGGADPVPIEPANVYGILSLIFWSVMIIVSFKYALFIMRADNQGQGGILALMALAMQKAQSAAHRKAVLVLGMIGAALFYGDGMITPAISVLSAVEGLEVATPWLEPYVVPITVAIVIGLFLVQRHGTASVGALFGPVMCVWFAALALLGLVEIAQAPAILLALDPGYAAAFFYGHPKLAFITLGAVVLAVTGAEALYADMGHFGRRPIQLAWFSLVLPALMLNYFGQGALLLSDPGTVKSPFFLLAPGWALYPLIGLSTAAAIIASQAVISGAFSISRQAIQLGLSPRLEVQHTSEEEIGQIYVPHINWMLLACVIVLIVGFRSSSNLASAYGIAVTGTMMIDTIVAFVVLRACWGWGLAPAALLCGALMIVDLMFFGANLLKFLEGGWFPLAIGGAIFILISTWYQGRAVLVSELHDRSVTVESFLARVTDEHPVRVPGTAVFMTGDRVNVPFSLLHNLKHNKVLHERTVLLSVVTEGVPFVRPERRMETEALGKGFHRLIVRYGFKELPDIPRALAEAERIGLSFNMMETSFFLGREKLVPSMRPHMARWRDWLFIWMSRNAVSATDFFRIPSNRVVELGAQVEV